MDKPWTVKLHRDNDWEEWQVVVRRPDGSVDGGKTVYTLDGTNVGREDAVYSIPSLVNGLVSMYGADNVVLLKGRLKPEEKEWVELNLQ